MKWTKEQCEMFAQENHGREVKGDSSIIDKISRVGVIDAHYDSLAYPGICVIEVGVGRYAVDPSTVKFTDGAPEVAPKAPGPLLIAEVGKTHCGAPDGSRCLACTRPVGHPPTVHVAHRPGAGEEIARWPVTAPAPAGIGGGGSVNGGVGTVTGGKLYLEEWAKGGCAHCGGSGRADNYWCALCGASPHNTWDYRAEINACQDYAAAKKQDAQQPGKAATVESIPVADPYASAVDLLIRTVAGLYLVDQPIKVQREVRDAVQALLPLHHARTGKGGL